MSDETLYINLNFSLNSSNDAESTCQDENSLCSWDSFDYVPVYERKWKTLQQLGYSPHEIYGWHRIYQTKKPHLSIFLKKCFEEGIFFDLAVYIGTAIFHCHKKVLYCYTKFFKMYAQDSAILFLEENITPNGFTLVYNWMLTDDPQVRRKDILEVFNAAIYLEIEPLIIQCWAYLENRNCIREHLAFMLFVETYQHDFASLAEVKPLMLNRIHLFFYSLVASKEFLFLSYTELSLLISSNEIGVNSEIEVFLSVVRWLHHDWEERKDYIVDVLQHVRFGLIPPWYLASLNAKKTDSAFINRFLAFPEVNNLITDGIFYASMQMQHENVNLSRFHGLINHVPPLDRDWVYDIECDHHHVLNCPNTQNITYKMFIEYLEKKHELGINYANTLRAINDDSVPLQPCCKQRIYKSSVSTSANKHQAK